MLQIRKPSHRRIRQAPSEKSSRLDDDVDALTPEFINRGTIEPGQHRSSDGPSRLLERGRADNLDRRQHRKFSQFLLIGAAGGEYHGRKPAFLVGIEACKQIGQIIVSSGPGAAGDMGKCKTQGS